MDVIIENGEGLIEIVADGFSSCLKIRKPQAAIWPDCAGSVAMYYAASILSDEERKELTKDLNTVLKSGSDDDILRAIAEFLKLFTPGEYHVNVHNDYNWDYDIVPGGSPAVLHELQYTEYFTSDYYPFGASQFILTIAPALIDSERVAHYEVMIKEGGRPKVVIYSHDYQILETPSNGEPYLSSWDSGYFIIDGHHKLLAYAQCKIAPCIVFIRKIEKSHRENLFNELSTIADHSLLKHFVSHKPWLAISGTQGEMKHNAVLDSYLSSCRRVEVDVLEVFIKAYHMNDSTAKIWLTDRLAVLEKRVKHKCPPVLLHKTFIENFAGGTFTGMMWADYPINSLTSFENWKRKIFDTDADTE